MSLSAKARWNIEEGFDYAYLTVDGDVGPDEPCRTRASAPTASRAAPTGNWETLTADLSAFAGGTQTIGFGYLTDGGVQGADRHSRAGFRRSTSSRSPDSRRMAPRPILVGRSSNQTDQGFHITSGTETFSYFNAYIAEYRNYGGYDKALKLGPYNFDDPDRRTGSPTSRTRTAC